jgi:DNA-binding NarL/FixJ family response regulator
MVTSRTIVIADDHPIMRMGILSVLQHAPGLSVIGEASNGIQVVDMCRELRPDILLLDIHLAKIEGLMVVRLLKNACKIPRIILMSDNANAALVQTALDIGVSGYILKNVAGNDLLDAIYRVMHGHKVLMGVDKPQTNAHPALSVQELMTLHYVASGLSTKEIAWRMNNSTRTIETYMQRVFCKLGANNRTQAVAIAHREQLLLVEGG